MNASRGLIFVRVCGVASTRLARVLAFSCFAMGVSPSDVDPSTGESPLREALRKDAVGMAHAAEQAHAKEMLSAKAAAARYYQVDPAERKALRKENPAWNLAELTTELATRWRAKDDAARKPWVQAALQARLAARGRNEGSKQGKPSRLRHHRAPAGGRRERQANDLAYADTG